MADIHDLLAQTNIPISVWYQNLKYKRNQRREMEFA